MIKDNKLLAYKLSNIKSYVSKTDGKKKRMVAWMNNHQINEHGENEPLAETIFA